MATTQQIVHHKIYAATVEKGASCPRPTPSVQTSRVCAVHCTPLLGVGPGLEVSRSHLLQDRQIERLISDNPLEA